MESNNIDPKIRGIVLEDLIDELFPERVFISYTYKQQMEFAKVDRYLTTGLNLCDDVNELLIIIPDYLISTIKRLSFKNLILPQEIPERFTEFLQQNQIAIELIAYIHITNLLTK